MTPHYTDALSTYYNMTHSNDHEYQLALVLIDEKNTLLRTFAVCAKVSHSRPPHQRLILDEVTPQGITRAKEHLYSAPGCHQQGQQADRFKSSKCGKWQWCS